VVFSGALMMDPNVPSSDIDLWFQTTHDCSSAVTGSSVFDFNGDLAVQRRTNGLLAGPRSQNSREFSDRIHPVRVRSPDSAVIRGNRGFEGPLECPPGRLKPGEILEKPGTSLRCLRRPTELLASWPTTATPTRRPPQTASRSIPSGPAGLQPPTRGVRIMKFHHLWSPAAQLGSPAAQLATDAFPHPRSDNGRPGLGPRDTSTMV
jgi:hypothetical protein